MIDAVILAGGEGRRMGGQDKGLVDLAGRPLVAWMVDILKRQSQPLGLIHISANRNQAEYAHYGYPVLADLNPVQAGPLAGIHAALQGSLAEYVLAVPCDLPMLPDDLVARLWQALQAHDADVAYARAGDNPAFSAVCLMHRRVLPGLAQRLDQQARRLGEWYRELKSVGVDFSSAQLQNLNSPEEVAALSAQIQSHSGLTHFNQRGEAHMVGIGAKAETRRIAIAEGEIRMAAATLAQVSGGGKKGDVLGVARIAAIMAAKKTADVIPLCHPIPLTHIDVEFYLEPEQNRVRCQVTAETFGRTGIEMEALTAVSIGLLTIYDMLKAVDRGMVIGNTRLLEKQGGRSGHWKAAN